MELKRVVKTSSIKLIQRRYVIENNFEIDLFQLKTNFLENGLRVNNEQVSPVYIRIDSNLKKVKICHFNFNKIKTSHFGGNDVVNEFLNSDKKRLRRKEEKTVRASEFGKGYTSLLDGYLKDREKDSLLKKRYSESIKARDESLLLEKWMRTNDGRSF